MLDVHRRNLYNGGAYFVNKQNFKEAYNFFDMYLNCSIQPLFTGYKYGETDKICLRLLIGQSIAVTNSKTRKLRFIMHIGH